MLTIFLPFVLMCCSGLGSNPDQLKWFAESERVHSRWAMLAVAGILAQVCIMCMCAACGWYVVCWGYLGPGKRSSV